MKRFIIKYLLFSLLLTGFISSIHAYSIEENDIITSSTADWITLACGTSKSSRNVVASTNDALITKVTQVSANSSLANGIARVGTNTNYNVATTTSTKRTVRAYYDLNGSEGHNHKFKSLYG